MHIFLLIKSRCYKLRFHFHKNQFTKKTPRKFKTLQNSLIETLFIHVTSNKSNQKIQKHGEEQNKDWKNVYQEFYAEIKQENIEDKYAEIKQENIEDK